MVLWVTEEVSKVLDEVIGVLEVVLAGLEENRKAVRGP